MDKQRTEKFKQTRELVSIALETMSQLEIANLCRTNQSAVSDWANGKRKANEHVIRPLLTRFGHRLQRASGRYYLIETRPATPEEELGCFAAAARAREIKRNPKSYLRERMDTEGFEALFPDDAPEKERSQDYEPGLADNPVGAAVLEHMITESEAVQQLLREVITVQCMMEMQALRDEVSRRRLVRLEGAPIWRHLSYEYDTEWFRSEYRWRILSAKRRLIVHTFERSQFWLVDQFPNQLDRRLYRLGISESNGKPQSDSGLLSEDLTRWHGRLLGPLELSELISEAERCILEMYPHDRAIAPFTLRKALAEAGFPTDIVVSPFDVTPKQ